MIQNALPATIAPPHDLEAESALLGSLVRLSMAGQGAQALGALCGLTADDFWRDRHRAIFSAIGEMLVTGVPVDLTTLGDALVQRGALEAAGGKAYLLELLDVVPVPGNVAHYAQMVRRLAVDREIRRIGLQIGAGEDLTARVDRLAELRAELAVIETGRPQDPNLEIVFGPSLENVPQPEWLVPGLLRKTVVSLLAGPPRQGKSLAAEALAVHLAAGQEWGHFAVDRARKVLYFSAEDGPELTGPRVMQLSAGLGLKNIPPGLAFCFRAFKADETAGNEAIRKRIRRAGAECVIFDVLLNFHGADENDNGAMAGVMQHFLLLARELDVSILLLHHHRKSTTGGDEGDAIDKSRGASSITGSCPIIISGRRTCYKVHSKYGTVDDFALTLNEGTYPDGGGPWMRLKAHAPADTPEAREHITSAVAAVAELAPQWPAGVSMELAAMKAGVSVNTIRGWLYSAVQAGRLEVVSEGKSHRKLYRPR